MSGRPNLLRNGIRSDGMNFEDRIFNDGEAEIILIDLDRQDRIAAEYYRQREACLAEIKNSQGSTSKVSSAKKINDFQRLIAERDFIYQQEEEYLKDLHSMQGLYIKKKEIDARGERPPIDLLEKVKSLIGDLRAKKNRIENQKVQFATKFEKKRANLSDGALNNSSLAGLSASIFKVKGIDREVADLSMRMNKVEDMKASSLLTSERPAQKHGQQPARSRPSDRSNGAERRCKFLRTKPAQPDNEHPRL